MSTDEQRSDPDDRAPETGQEPVEHSAPEPTPLEQSEAPIEEPATDEPSVIDPVGDDPALEAPVTEEPVTEEPAAAPAPDETHIALPAQRRDDPFSEVDGGEPDGDHVATTAFPTPEEDAELRDERARRFGRPRAEGEAEPVIGEAEPETQAVPATEEEPTSRVPLAAAGAGAVATVGATGTTQTMPATTEGDDDPFKDFDEGPASRAAAHWWSILISVVFTPIAWYLIADGGDRMNWNLNNGGPFNPAGPLELAGGLLCLFFVLLAARWSSIGAILVGTFSALVGIAFVVFNTEVMDLVAEYQGPFVQALNQLGQNIVDHLLADARSGRLAVYGVALVMVGVVSHGARRQGRREERRKAAIGA